MSNGTLGEDLISIYCKSKVRKEKEAGNGNGEHLVLSVCHPSMSNYADTLWLKPQENGNNITGAKRGEARDPPRLLPQSSFLGAACHRCSLLRTEPHCSLCEATTAPESEVAALSSDGEGATDHKVAISSSLSVWG